MDSKNLLCECGHEFTVDSGSPDKFVRCPGCGVRVLLEQVREIKDFLLVPRVLRDRGAVDEPVTGSLAVTLDSITFIGPEAQHPIRLKQKVRKLTPVEKMLSLTGSIITLVFVISFASLILHLSKWDTRTVAFALAMVFAAVVQVAVAILRFRRRRREKQDSAPAALDKDLDRFIEFRKGRRTLYEQIARSSNVEKKIKTLVKYRENSVRMPRKAIREVRYDSRTELTVIGPRKSFAFKIPEQYHDRLYAILTGYRYIQETPS
jgi:DNA-directed RNA polymerase subunit RPC12/RpoP